MAPVFTGIARAIGGFAWRSTGIINPVEATGGTISYSGGKTIHKFTAPGTFLSPTALKVDYLLVGGGGAGGGNNGAGGGGGEEAAQA